MEILKDYADVLQDIDYLKDQIKDTEYEFKWWSGVDVNKGEGEMLGGVGVKMFGVESGMIQIEKKRRALNNLYERLNMAERKKSMIENHLGKYEGLDYQVAYKKYVEKKPLYEIAEELHRSYGHIKNISMKLGKCDQDVTDILKSV